MANESSSIASLLTSEPAHSIFVWLPILLAGKGFFLSSGAHVVRESSTTVSLIASLAAIINIINVITIIIIIIISSITIFIESN